MKKTKLQDFPVAHTGQLAGVAALLFTLHGIAQAAEPSPTDDLKASETSSKNKTTKTTSQAQSNDTATTLDTVTVAGSAPLNPPNQKLQLDTEATTGSRLGLTPRETPASITIIDRATFEKRGAQTTQEALEKAPGILVSSQPGSAGSVSMRGFTGAQITQLFNGITVQYDVVAARPIDSWITDRVEVLGGPSTFLYGQGAVGGLVNYVSKIAHRGPDEHHGLVSLGEYLNRRASYGFNGQLGNTDNWLQADISYLGSEGYIDNTEADSGVMSFSLLSDITSKLSHTIAFEHQMEDRDSYWGTPVLNPVVNGRIVPWGTEGLGPNEGRIDPGTRFKNYNATGSVFDQQVFWLRDIVDYQLSDNTQFKNTFYYYKADRQYLNVEGYDWNSTNSLITRNQSFAVNHDQALVGNRFEIVHSSNWFSLPSKVSAGVDIAYNKQTRAPSMENGATTVSVVDPYNFSTGTYYDNPLATGPVSNARNELYTVAGYAENRLTLVPDLNLVTGVRVDDIRLDSKNLRTSFVPPTATNPAAFGRRWTAVTWRAALMYDITSTFNVYAQYSTAADPPSGILTTGTFAALQDFDLTTGRQAEVGTKFDFWNGRGSATLAGYYIERKNLSMTDPSDRNRQLPIGAQSSGGMEANIGVKLTDEWSVQGNMAYVDAQYDKFLQTVGTSTVSRKGNRPANVAKWVANAWLTWDFDADWQWNFGSRYVGDRFVDTANLIKAPAYAVFDTQLAWKFNPKATVTARVKNLTDEQYVEWGNGGNAPLFFIAAPRTFMMELKVDF
ncbi:MULTISPECIES: TonB-dependent receptor [Methylomonas]|uniref:TonB-dependent receptor n=2 Tax=Methylomonas TaxID=416 RepID=A0A126T8R2_9GAMM|nr:MULTISPECIES: TonB-dependent receptor [Methylomonas]AMK78451.1 TonB-dependent receptor [Methylomonas denitrificans]OAI04153.1 TonB-dependent receptor [Methylomonas methanica]TCV87519.1 iron complex outermembrane receptor protein [Methylomonas methanica]